MILRGPHPPAVIQSSIENIRYAIDGRNWIPITDNLLSHEQALAYYYSVTVGETKKLVLTFKPRKFEVFSNSQPDKKYIVEFTGVTWTCECLGYQFRRTCKHIDACKTK